MVDQVPIPISALPAATALTGAELFPLVQNGITKKGLISQIEGGGGGSGGGGALFSTVVVLTAADIVSMYATPIPLVNSPGEGLTVIPLLQTFQAVLGDQNMTEESTLAVYWGDKDGIPASENPDSYPSPDLIGSNSLDSTDTNRLLVQHESGFINGPPNDTPTTDIEDKALVITTALGNPPWGCDQGTGPVLALTVNDGGSGYAVGDTGILTTSGDGNCLCTVLTVSGGAITSLLITDPGTGYETTTDIDFDSIAPQIGVGVGGTVDIWVAGDADCTLTVTTYYVIVPQATEPTVVPSNSTYQLFGNGIESWSRLSNYTGPSGGTSFPTGFQSFATSGLSFANYHRKSNLNNPDIISINGSNQLVINYPCFLAGNVGLTGIVLQTPFSADTVLSHGQDDNFWGDSSAYTGAIGVLTMPAIIHSATTGPLFSNVGDIWDGNINIEAVGPTGNVLKIQQANFGLQILQVLGQIVNASVSDGGTGYVVGDTFQIDDGYVPAVATVTAVTVGVVTAFSFANNTTARGLGYINQVYDTSNIVPQIGSGTGLQIEVLNNN